MSDPVADERDWRIEMNDGLLNVSSALFTSDPLFHTRCQITGHTIAYAMHKIGESMTREIYAAVMQAAAVAIVMAAVPDDELSDNVDHGKVLVSMMEYESIRAQMNAKLARETEGEL